MPEQDAGGDKTRKSAKQDLFDHPDFYQIDDLLTEEQKLIRSSIRDFVKRQISPYIEDWAQRAYFPPEIVKKVWSYRRLWANDPCGIRGRWT